MKLSALGALSAALLAVGLPAATAAAATSGSGLFVRGAGNGHGVGMSQYGAAGYALHGSNYEQILHAYYAGTTLGHVDPDETVTVLLRSSGSALFAGATRIKGSPLKLNPLWVYSVFPAVRGRLRIKLGKKQVGVFPAPLQVSGPEPLKLLGLGSYRGDFVFRPSPGGNGVMTVNALGLDDYVRGVVAAEMPPSWPTQALEAQAVATRTYALTSKPIGAAFDVYDTTRSQAYEGVKVETPASDAAVAATSGQAVEYAGVPVATYFFSSSGGETESDQNVFGLAPEAWLVGRPDPYDDALNNPYHQWKLSLSLAGAQRRLGALVKGSLLGIKVLQRGVSPRIITARVVGTKGSVTVTGEQLRNAFGTPSTWMSFRAISSHGVLTSTIPSTTTTLPTSTTTTTSTTVTSGGGGLIRHARPTADLRALAADALSGEFRRTSDFIERIYAALRIPTTRHLVTGTIFPARDGSRLAVQLRTEGRWSTVVTGHVGRGGRYSVQVAHGGIYRVRFHSTVGPAITVG